MSHSAAFSGMMAPGILYRVEDCFSDQTCFMRIETGSFDPRSDPDTQLVVDLPSKHVYCGVNLHLKNGMWVGRLSLHVNATFYNNSHRAPLVFNYSNRDGTSTMLGYKFRNMRGPSVYPGHHLYAASYADGSLEGTFEGPCLFNLCTDSVNVSAFLRFTETGWSCRGFTGRF